MDSERIMPVSTQAAVIEQFSEHRNNSVEPGKQLNQMFFNMMLKSLFESPVTGEKSSATTQMHQQLYLNVLTKELSDSFDMGFSKLQFEIEQQESK